MKIFNNKLANITTFVFWDKVDYFDFSHVIKKETIYMFFVPVYVMKLIISISIIFLRKWLLYTCCFFFVFQALCVIIHIEVSKVS